MEDKIKSIISVESLITNNVYSSYIHAKNGKLEREEYKEYLFKYLINDFN